MDYRIRLIPKDQYLHVIVSGTNTLENVLAFHAKLLEIVRSRGVEYVLVEEHLEGPRLSTTEVFEVAARGSERASGVDLRALAYVDEQAGDDMMKFAEMVATNRAMPVRVFTSIETAEKWLVETIARGGMQRE